MKKILAIMLAMFMLLGLVACGGDKTKSSGATGTNQAAGETKAQATGGEQGKAAATNGAEAPVQREEGTLVLASEDMNEIFNTPNTHSVPDRNIADLVQLAPLLRFDEKAAPNNLGICDYVEPEVKKDGDKTDVVYKFKIRDGVKFSDGTPITADDIIFNFKVYLDPNYVGDGVFYSLPIVGALEYKYDTPDYQKSLDEIASKVKEYKPSDEEINKKAQELFDEYSKDTPDLKLEQFKKDGEHFEGETLPALVKDYEAKLNSDFISKNLEDGIDIQDIEGVKKISDSEIEVHMNKIDPRALYQFNMNIIPQSYYGKGFKKGDLTCVNSKDKEPVGGGPYIFKGYKNNVVSLEANPNYYLGAPKIKNLKVQVVSQTNKLQSVARGETDISDPAASPDTQKEAEGYKNVHVELVDNNGYGYIGINAKNVPDKLVRQGIMYLLDRKPAVEAYYGDLASVIERPISRVNWAYPQNATEYYGFKPEKALEKFKEAGYEQKDGKLVKDGKQLHINVAYPGGNDDNHPVKPVFTTLKTEAEKLGAVIDLKNMQGSDFFAALDAGTLDMWAAAWQATPDPDMTQIYASYSPGNKYHINNADLDKLIEEGRSTFDQEKRKEIYAKALDLVMEEAVEMPFYQRKNMYVYNTDHLNIDSLPDVMTPYWDHMSVIQDLELNQ